MTDIMLVGPKNMLVGHEGRTWGQSGWRVIQKNCEFVLPFGCNPQTHQS